MSVREKLSPTCLVALLTACGDAPASPDAVAAAAMSTLDVASEASPEAVAERAASEWPIFRGTPSLSGVAPGSLPEAPELLWTYAAEGPIASSPVVAGGLVYVGSDDMHLHAVDLATGEARWRFATEDIVEAPALVHDGAVYIGGHDFFFYALDATTGELRWKQELGDKVLGGANHVPGPDGVDRIIVGCYDTNLYCFDARTGDEVWKYSTDNYVNGTPAVSGDRIVFGGCDAGLHVVSASTGQRIAKLDLGEECYVAGSVGLDGERAYLGHYGNAFVCADLASGELIWSYPSPRHAFFSSPAILPDRIVFGGRDKNMHCVSIDEGEPIWTFKTRRKIDASPVVCGGRVVFGSADGRVYVLDLEDGAELWSFEIGRAILGSPAVVDGRILVGSTDGKLYAFGEPR